MLNNKHTRALCHLTLGAQNLNTKESFHKVYWREYKVYEKDQVYDV